MPGSSSYSPIALGGSPGVAFPPTALISPSSSLQAGSDAHGQALSMGAVAAGRGGLILRWKLVGPRAGSWLAVNATEGTFVPD